MTDATGRESPAPLIPSVDWTDPSELPVEEVRDIFLTLSKALRAYQLYDPANPVYKRFVTNLRESLARVWESQDRLQILITEDRFTWMGEEVYRNESRTESLAFMLYRDGLRDITLERGIEGREIESFLDVLHRVRNVRGEGDDLVTLLWDLDLRHFTYSAVEMGTDGDVDMGETPSPKVIDAAAILVEVFEEDVRDGEEGDEDDEENGSPAPPETVRAEDFNPAVFALDPEDQQYIRGELKREIARDAQSAVLDALFDRLEDAEDGSRQAEILGVFRTLIPSFLSRGALLPAASIAEEVVRLSAENRLFQGEARAAADMLVEDLSAPEAVQELVKALEDGSVAPDASELTALLKNLRPASLGVLLKGAEETRDEAVRDLLREAIEGLARGSSALVVELLHSDDTSIAVGAVRLAGRMKLADAGNAMVRLLRQGSRGVRKVIVETAAEVRSPVLAGALRDLLSDEDRELRVAAARVLGEIRYEPAKGDFEAILEDKAFRETDVTEKVAFFESFGMMAGPDAVGFLDKMLNGGRGFLGRKDPPEIRAGAALGLARAGGRGARDALLRAADDSDPVVRSAVSRALREVDDHG